MGGAPSPPTEEATMDDKALQTAVMNELKWDPEVSPAHIGVAVKDGAVTLTGSVTSYSEKYSAVRAAERVYGVKAVADEIEVKLPNSSKRDDSDIAEAIVHALRWNALVPDSVHVEVRNGYVTLRGDVEWNFQRDAAVRAVRDVIGVKGVANLITVKPKVKASEVKQRVQEAIERTASIDARGVYVTATNGTVHLHGTVHSLFEKRVAENAAKAAPGVKKVDNEIMVMP
jgi:osmotically-inducible protein OsmY